MGKLWYRNPYKYIDDDDLGHHYLRQARIILGDLLVMRPTEEEALFTLFRYATYNTDGDMQKTTSRQQQAVEYAIEAMYRGKNAAKYVALKLGVHISNAYRLLERADFRAKIANFERFLHSISRDVSISWTPTEDQVRNKMASMPRLCAGSGTGSCAGTTRGDHSLCWNCYQTYGIRGEWPPRQAKWLEPEVRRIENEHRIAALNALYEDYRSGTIEIEETALPMAA